MIKSNDLRKGNFVQLDKDTIGIVEELKTLSARCSYVKFDSLATALIRYEDLEPIALTEDWLVRMGFRKDLLDASNHDEGFYYSLALSDDPRGDLSFLDGDKNGFLEVTLFPYSDQYRYQYVHRVQNVFYALTGQELEVENG